MTLFIGHGLVERQPADPNADPLENCLKCRRVFRSRNALVCARCQPLPIMRHGWENDGEGHYHKTRHLHE